MMLLLLQIAILACTAVDCGKYAVQGLREYMEDTMVARFPWFAVFDGHAGDEAALFLQNHAYHAFEGNRFGTRPIDYAYAIRHALLRLDHVFLTSQKSGAGSTAVIAAVLPKHIIFGNVGDSRAVFAAKGKVIGATLDHKPNDKEERSRIERAGGFVRGNRVLGMLALSRAIGDRRFKARPMVTAEADVYIFDRDLKGRGYLIIASDGFWDVFTNQEAARMLRGKFNCSEKANELVKMALRRGSQDNVSVIIVSV
jgi:serine/threonine protein phosphatase PrpC